MLRTKTVFVVGAGASCEFGFPSGPELLKRVADDLDISISFSDQKSGDPMVLEGIKRHHRRVNSSLDINKYLYAGRRLRDAAGIARSIDNAIDQNDLDPLVPVVAKLAIAREIIKSEAISKLKSKDYTSRAAPAAALKDTWLYELGRILTTDVKASNAENIFSQISFITFNYDRTLEHALPTIMKMAYGFSDDECAKIASNCRIWHPYGSLGSVRADREGSMAFGGEGSIDIVSEGLRTFGESLLDDAPVKEWRAALAEADQIVFIGFGFHPPNIDLLMQPDGLIASRIIATVYGEFAPAVLGIRHALNQMFVRAEIRAQAAIELVNLTGREMLQQYYLPLTSR